MLTCVWLSIIFNTHFDTNNFYLEFIRYAVTVFVFGIIINYIKNE